jgi:tetratricopeptide (TPR) repeat protein
MQTGRRRLGGAVAAALVGAQLLGAQVQQGAGANRLSPADPRAAAITEYNAALDAYQSWSWTEGFAHVQRALALDSSFGLARALYARYRGGPTAGAERTRAASDAVRGTAPEAVIALATSTSGEASAALWDVAAKLVPNDPRVALDRALNLAGRERTAALREVTKRFPESAPAKQWLAYSLTVDPFPRPPKADADEALSAAQDAVRLAPNSTGAHSSLGWVYERIGKNEEALVHLGHATSISPPFEGAYQARAELFERLGRIPEARTSLDSAILLTDNLGNRITFMSDRALTFLHEGNLSATLDALEDAARDARAHDQRPAEATVHGLMAIVHAASGNLRGAEEQVAIERRLGATSAALADNTVIVYSLLRQGAAARRALESYVQQAAAQAPEARAYNVHRMTGLTLLAEGKAVEAIEELKQGGPNPYSQLGLIEAYTQLGRKKDADAERASMLAKQEFSVGSSAMPIVKYRASRK